MKYSRLVSAEASRNVKAGMDYNEALVEMQNFYSLFSHSTNEVSSELARFQYDYNSPLNVLPPEYTDLINQCREALNLAGRISAKIQLMSAQELYK